MKLFTTAAFAAAMLCGTSAFAADLEVAHWWTSGGEQAAVSVFASEFEASGEGKWIDNAIAGGENSRSSTLQRILGGDPPGAAQFNPGRQYEELIAGGQLLDLTPLAEAEGWAKLIRPASISSACLIDGHWWCVPVNIHSWNWAWASIPAFKKAGVELPTSFDDFLTKAPKLKEAGVIPFAIGGESWQISGAFGVLQTSMLGVEKREKILKDKDLELAQAEMPAVFTKWREFKQWSDAGSANRNWNDTTNLVVTDQAALQIMGDWARGEFGVAGKKPGVDYACLALPVDAPTVTTGGDIFLFPKNKDPAVEASQLKLASLMISPRVQALFNNAKGSMPVRDDVDMSLADDCMKTGLKIIGDEKNIAQDAGRWLSNDTTGQMNDLAAQFWADDTMTVDAAVAKYIDILKTAN
jgi:glucose/mannose transport system substrate-binding protein